MCLGAPHAQRMKTRNKRSSMQGLTHLESHRGSRMWDILTGKARRATTKISRGKDPSLIGLTIEPNDSLEVIMGMEHMHSLREL